MFELPPFIRGSAREKSRLMDTFYRQIYRFQSKFSKFSTFFCVSLRMSNAGKARSGRFRRTSKRGSSAVEETGIELAELFATKVALQPTLFQFNSEDPACKEKMGLLVWRSDLLVDTETPALRTGNPELVQLMLLLTKNTYQNVSTVKESLWQESLLSNLARIKSQKAHTLLTVRSSVEALRVQLNRDFWHYLHLTSPGILTSHGWAEDFVDYAFKLRPPPAYEVLLGVGCIMFDNYTRKVNYSSVHTTDSWGFRLDMTNSCSMKIPRHLAPANFDADAICNACPSLSRMICV